MPGEVVPRALQQQRIARLHRDLLALQLLVASTGGEEHEFAVGRGHPGVHLVPMSGDRGGTTTSVTPLPDP